MENKNQKGTENGAQDGKQQKKSKIIETKIINTCKNQPKRREWKEDGKNNYHPFIHTNCSNKYIWIGYLNDLTI